MEVIRRYEVDKTGAAPREVLVSFLEREMPWGLEFEMVAEREYEGVSLRKVLLQQHVSFEDRRAVKDSFKAEMKSLLLRLGWLKAEVA